MAKTSAKQYNHLLGVSKEGTLLSAASVLLQWDRDTYMPPEASNARAEQLELLAGLAHQHKTSKKFARALSKLIDIETGTILADDLPSHNVAALKEWRRDYRKAIALPDAFVKAFAKLSSQSIVAWQSAKKEDAFMQFAPYLERLVEMNRKKADLLGYKDHPYDALLDEYEPDLTTKEVSTLFASLNSSLSSLLDKIVKAKQVDDSFLFGEFPKEKQLHMGEILLKAMGYDFSKGRLDTSAHPFSSASHPTDSRVTTRIHASSLMSNIFSVLHEGGHGLYEMGLPAEHFGSPLCEPLSHGIHESQSRWWETRIGRSKPFWQHFLPILKDTFKPHLNEVNLDAFYRAINKVKPSLIRVEADEVTYNLHVILRFEIEKGLIENTIAIRDIPELWNTKMQKYLGITPKSNAEGCLQDIHWSMGAFGYFPSYTLGNLYGSHLFEAFTTQFPNWQEKVKEGELIFIKTWLNEAVHQHGRRYPSIELLKKVSGKNFSETPFVTYLNKKYGEIYGF